MRAPQQHQAKKKNPLQAHGYALLFVCLGFGAAQAADEETQQKTNFFFAVRERLEHQENFNDKFYGSEPKIGNASDTYLLSRIRLGLSHQFTEQLSGKISLQDSRALGWGFDDEDWKNSEFGGIVNNPQNDPLELGELAPVYS